MMPVTVMPAPVIPTPIIKDGAVIAPGSHHFFDRLGRRSRGGGESVGTALGKDDQVAGGELERPRSLKAQPAASLIYHVEGSAFQCRGQAKRFPRGP